MLHANNATVSMTTKKTPRDVKNITFTSNIVCIHTFWLARLCSYNTFPDSN